MDIYISTYISSYQLYKSSKDIGRDVMKVMKYITTHIYSASEGTFSIVLIFLSSGMCHLVAW